MQNSPGPKPGALFCRNFRFGYFLFTEFMAEIAFKLLG